MRLAIVGGKSAFTLQKIIQSQIDGIVVDVFGDVDSFVENSSMRSIVFDRMILMYSGFRGMTMAEKEEKLIGLLGYLKKKMPELRVVTMCKSDEDYEMFLKLFNSPIYANIKTMSDLTSRMILNMVELSMDELREKYEVRGETRVQAIQQEIQVQGVQTPKKQGGFFSRLFNRGKKGTDTSNDISAENSNNVSGAEDSTVSGVQGSLTGEIGSDSESVENVDNGAEIDDLIAELTGEATIDFDKNSTLYGNDDLSSTSTEFKGEKSGLDMNEQRRLRDEASQPVEAIGSDGVHESVVMRRGMHEDRVNGQSGLGQSAISNGDLNGTVVEHGVQMEVGTEQGGTAVQEDRTEEASYMQDRGSRASRDTESGKGSHGTRGLNIVDTDEEDVVFAGNEGVSGTPKRSTVNQDIQREVSSYSFNGDTSGVQLNIAEETARSQSTGLTVGGTEDDVDDGFSASFVGTVRRRRKPSIIGDISGLPSFTLDDVNDDTVGVEEAEDSGGLGIDLDEVSDAYNASTEPKVVEKIVERVIEKPVEKIVEKVVEVEKPVEVVRTVEKPVYIGGTSGGRHIFKDIVKGNESAIFIVTGDRRSGVTSTALAMANLFGGVVETLYVDFDTVRRGSLLHLGIQNIVDEDEAVQHGIVVLKNAKALPQLVYRGNNKFASLVANFDIDVEDESITTASNALAVQHLFKVMVIDCPLEKLHLLDELLSISDVFLCIEGTAQSIMNTMSELQELGERGIPRKLQNLMYRNSKVIVTGDIGDKEFEENKNFVDDIFSLRDQVIPWILTGVLGNVRSLAKIIKNI